MNALFVLVRLKRKAGEIKSGEHSMQNAPQNRFFAVPWTDDCNGSSKTNHLRHPPLHNGATITDTMACFQ
ncbi:hypothetical protein OAH23_07805 [Verrucomicrobia bacterium]|nr:hypothetical protein [Verrucomicrobiota bacterium]